MAKALKAESFEAGAPAKGTPGSHAPGPEDEGHGPRPLIIDSGRNPLAAGMRELWSHRELLFFLAWRDVKVRYKQTVLGAAWAILQPFMTMVVFSLLFGRLAKVPSDGVPYPVFAYAGLLPWTFFSNTAGTGGNSLVSNASLITKVYFPRMVIPGAVVLAGLADFGLAALILFGMIAWYGLNPGLALLMLPALIVLLTVLAAAVAMWFAALNVHYRDVRHALPFILQLWLYVTPIIYPVSFVPARWRWVLRLNPLTGIIEGFRSALLGRPFDWDGLGISAALTAAILAYALWSFRRMEHGFADVI